MPRIRLAYQFGPSAHGSGEPGLHHPLLAMLAAVQAEGSISGAARSLGLSYRHVWGELKRWEAELGQPLVCWVKGQAALLAPAGERLLGADRGVQQRLGAQIEALRQELDRAFALALGESRGVAGVGEVAEVADGAALSGAPPPRGRRRRSLPGR